jgi:hypothetical protein
MGAVVTPVDQQEGIMRAAREKGMGEFFPLLISRRGNHESSQGERNGGIFPPVDQQEREP